MDMKITNESFKEERKNSMDSFQLAVLKAKPSFHSLFWWVELEDIRLSETGG
jgi:hypothetical protein